MLVTLKIIIEKLITLDGELDTSDGIFPVRIGLIEPSLNILLNIKSFGLAAIRIYTNISSTFLHRFHENSTY